MSARRTRRGSRRNARERNRGSGSGSGSGSASPFALLGPSGRRALVWLALLAGVKAAALILVAEALTSGIVSVAHGTSAWRPAVAWGLAGAVLRGIAVWATRVVAKRASGTGKAELRADLARHLMSAREPRVGAMTALGTKSLDELDSYFTTYLPALAGAMVTPLAVGGWILLHDWLSAVIILVTIPLVPVFMILIGLHTRDEVTRASDSLLRLSDHLVELARGLPVLVGLGRVRDQSRALARLSDEYRVRTMRTLRTAFMSSLALELISTISVAVVAVCIGLRLVYGSMDLGVGLAVLILAAECYTPFREVGSAFHASEDGVAALRRVRGVLGEGTQLPLPAEEPADGGCASAGLRGSTAQPETPSVVLRGVDVVFPGRPPLLDGFEAVFPRGSAVLLDGPSGAGKSTVIDLLTGRLGVSDDEGTPKVSGTLFGVDRGRIAWVPQHPTALALTVSDELVLHAAGAAPGTARNRRLRSAAARVLAEVGLSDPEQRSATLSPGELRRLAVARALLRVDEGADLLLLDEPTAHLDDANAARVREAVGRRLGAANTAIAAGAVTAVVASHDPLVQAMCDARIPVPDGSPLGPPATDSGLQHDPLPGRRDSGHGGSEHVREAADAVVPIPFTDEAEPESHDGEAGSTDSRPSSTAAGRVRPRRPMSRPVLRELGAFLRPARGRLLLAVLLGALATGFGIAQTSVSGWLIVSAAEQPPILFLTVAIVGVRFFGIGRSALRYAERLSLHDAVFRGAGGMRERLWDLLATSGLRFSGMRRGGATIDLLVGDVDRVRDEVPRVVLPPIVAAVVLAAMAIAAAVLLPAAVAPLLALGAVGLVIAPLGARLADRRASAAEQADRSRLTRVFAAALSAAPELHVHDVDESVIARLDALEADAQRSTRRAAWAEGLGHAMVATAAVATAFWIVAASAQLPMAAHESGKLVAVFALGALALAEPLLDAVTAMQRSGPLTAMLARVSALRARLGEGGDHDSPARHRAGVESETPASTDAIPNPEAGLELSHVTARWPGQPDPVFADLSELVRPGEWLSVTGPSGSGKSTLLAVALGHLPPERGTVRAAGLTVEPDVSGRIAWCPQDAYLFDSTLRANLMLARPADRHPSDAEMVSVLHRTGLDGLLDSLEDGLDTRVGPSGDELSGGQRQRVAVARALLAEAPVLLLDEPTAHLDEAGAAELRIDLRDGLAERAVVCVTHHDGDTRESDLRLRLPYPGASTGHVDSRDPAGPHADALGSAPRELRAEG